MEIRIDTDYITLGRFLKLQGLAATGGEAKLLIQSGKVSVNGEMCTIRGKKLVSGDTVGFNDDNYTIIGSK